MDSQDIILDHYHHPRHVGRLQEATHSSKTENLSCGDSLTMDIVIKNGIIENIGWVGSGCALSQASASLLSEKVAGISPEDALKISGSDITELLGIETLSPARAKCAFLSIETLHQALNNTNS